MADTFNIVALGPGARHQWRQS